MTPEMGYHPAHMFPATAIHIPTADHKRPDFLTSLMDHDGRKDIISPAARPREENDIKAEEKKETEMKVNNGTSFNNGPKSGMCKTHSLLCPSLNEATAMKMKPQEIERLETETEFLKYSTGARSQNDRVMVYRA